MAGLVPFNRRGQNALSLRNDPFYNMLDDFFGEGYPRWPSRNLMNDTFKIDVEENEKEYSVSAELPGATKDQVGVDFQEGRLCISVNREDKVNEESKNYIHREIRRTSASRSVYLSDGAADGIKAKMEDGVLTVTIQKQKKEETARKIDIE